MMKKIIREFQEQIECQHINDRYESAIRKVLAILDILGQRLTEEAGRPVIDNTTWRIKSAESMVKKLERKNRDVTIQCALETLNDIAGIRVICPFQDDVFRVAGNLKKEKSLRIIKVKNYIDQPKVSGYRSIHLIIEIQDDDNCPVRVEIQIRSVAMNYWAILDHQLCYKNENKNTEKIRKELKYYAHEIAEIDKKMLKLRKRIEKI